MLVGEVRCARTPTGSSWKLSGGSQWSSGPTKVSKKLQVRRAAARRKRVCSEVSRASRRASGRLAHHAMAGEKSHSSRIGDAENQSAATVSAVAGPIHIRSEEHTSEL